MADYKINPFGGVLYTGGELLMIIPEDTENGDWLVYLDWLSQGNTPDPAYSPEEIVAKELADAENLLNSKTRQANTQVNALTGRITTLQWLINEQDVEDEDYTEPSPEEIAELPVRKSQLTKWNSYNTKLGRVKLQSTWPSSPIWPVTPELYTTDVSRSVN